MKIYHCEYLEFKVDQLGRVKFVLMIYTSKVVARNPIRLQRAQEGKYVMLLYSQTLPEEASIHTAEMTAMTENITQY